MVFRGKTCSLWVEPQDAGGTRPSGKQKGRKQRKSEEPSWAGLRSGLTDSILCLRMISLKARKSKRLSTWALWAARLGFQSQL